MATQDASNDYFFDGFIEDLVNRDIELGDDNQSDLLISSVHTSDLSDFDPADFFCFFNYYYIINQQPCTHNNIFYTNDYIILKNKAFPVILPIFITICPQVKAL